MLNETYRGMLAHKSVIRETFMYGKQRAAEIGYENVFDYSLGNPSVPCPEQFTAAMQELLAQEDPVALHGYCPSQGDPEFRTAVAAHLNRTFGLPYAQKDIFPTTGAAGAIAHAVRAVTRPGDEVLTFAPYFPEYGPYVEGTGAHLRVVPPQAPAFQPNLEAFEQMLQTRPVCKITVQRVMEQAQMKRQSFYYHYQDIYSVLEWIVETQLCAPLQYDGAQAPGEWCLQALTLLREKQPLLRKISHALGQETMYRLTGKVIRPQLARLLPDPAAVDGATQSLALDMLCQAAFCTVDSLVARRTPLDAEAFMHQLQALFLTVQQI